MSPATCEDRYAFHQGLITSLEGPPEEDLPIAAPADFRHKCIFYQDKCIFYQDIITRLSKLQGRHKPSPTDWVPKVRELLELWRGEFGAPPPRLPELDSAPAALEAIDELLRFIPTPQHAPAAGDVRSQPDTSPASAASPAQPNNAPPLEPPAQEQAGSHTPAKEPSKDAIAAYRLYFLQGCTQSDIAAQLSEELGRAIPQGTVSRRISAVREYIQAGNVLPGLDAPRNKKPTSVDPARLDLGKRQDGRKGRR